MRSTTPLGAGLLRLAAFDIAEVRHPCPEDISIRS
jgi:hypothetical protein